MPIPVLLVVHSLGHGGTERQVAATAGALSRDRWEPHVASVLGGFRADELRAKGIPVLTLPLRTSLDPGPVSLTRFIRDYVRKHGIQLIHSFDPGLSPIAVMAARTLGSVSSLTSQRFFMETIPAKYRYMLLASHWLSDGIVTNTQVLRDYLHQTYKYPLSRIEVCHNGLDTALFPAGPRQRLDVVRDAPLVIGTVAVLRPEKNIALLLQAFARVQSPGAKLLIVGSGPDEKALRDLSAQLRLEQNCQFVTSMPDVAGALRSIDIFVLPSLSEGMPNALMEAMSCGCCVVASRVGGCLDLVEDGVHGLLIPPSDIDAMVSALQTVVSQPGLRARMGDAAAMRIRAEFSIESAARRMGEIYERRLKPPE